MKIRAYSKDDKMAVLELIRSNTPEYFSPSEERDLVIYLDDKLEDYFVVELDGQIIGAGGINYFPNDKTARISWDMISPQQQGKGVGKFLTEHRIKRIKEFHWVEKISVRTSQHAFKFYAKVGFELEKIEKDFWAKGFDLYLMKIDNGLEPKLSK